MSNSTSKNPGGQPSSNGHSITRFARGQACPVCGGSDSDRRGQGHRCHGFISGDWVHCSREEHAGKAKFHPESRTYSHRARGTCPCGVEHAPAVLGSGFTNGRKKEIDHVYKYRNSEGKTVHETIRYKNPKSFAQRRPIGGGKYAWSLKGVETILYHLPELDTADPGDPVWIVEGEKDADRLGSQGLLAVTNPMGAGKWRETYSEALANRHCFIVPDNDKDGLEHAQAVASSLHGKAASVRIVPLPGLPEKGDVSDFLAVPGRTVKDLCKIADRAPLFVPTLAIDVAVQDSPKKGNGQNGTTDFSSLTDEELGLVSAADVVPVNVDWLWEYHLASGEMALLAGEGGLGKSMFMLACCTSVTTGGLWPDKTGHAPLGHVVIVSAEDNAETTLRPRLEALGADLTKVAFCKAKIVTKHDGQLVVSPMSLQNHGYWKAVFDRFPDTKLFIVDPIPSYLGRGVNDRQNSEIRAVLEPFIEDVIRTRGICMYCNTHLSKSVDARTPVQRITGSIAYVNIPRNVHIIMRDPDQPDKRFWKQCKCNNGPDDLGAVGFKIEKTTIDFKGQEIETAVPVFDDQLHKVDFSALMNAEKGKRGPRPAKSSKLAEWLWEQLRGGNPVAVSLLVDRAREEGLLASPSASQPKPSISPLYNALDRIPELHPGWLVDLTSVSTGTGAFRKDRKAWKLVQNGEDQPAEDIRIDDNGPPY